MSYQVLARKWRPKNFEQLMGQDHVVNVLVNALSQERLHHAYLFTGTRGVGKTTIARIFAKSLNCETGITATPCGVCDTCVDIDQGRFVDLLEIDAASKTKVDDTREILDNVQYAPSRGRFKVYLIDEVHMLSRNSFNALLKTLEEPPSHVKFILATTDPQKLPVTVLSRCLQFHLKALTVPQIEAKLKEILTQENVSHEPGVLAMLAKAARGSMRDSLSLTDQAIAQGQGNIKLVEIQQMLGSIDQNWVYKIVISLLKQDAAELMALSQKIASYAPNYSRLFAELIQLFHQTALMQLVEQHFDLPKDHLELMKKFSRAISAQDLQLYYQICLNGRKDLPYASDEQAAFDMTLIRLLAFKPMQANDIETQSSNHSLATNSAPAIDFSDALKDQEPQQEPTLEQKIITAPEIVPEPLTSPELEQTQQAESEPVLENNASDQQGVELPSQAIDDSYQPPLEQSNAAVDNQQALEQQMAGIEQDAQQLHQEPTALNSSMPTQPVIPEQAIEAATNQTSDSLANSPISAVLAKRNMLRSRKRQLETTEKKSSDAQARQSSKNDDAAVSLENNKEQVTPEKEILPEPEQAYQPEKIDPSVVRKANQVDKWAHMIDSMELTARIRQLAIHATIDDKSTDDNLVLRLDQGTKHLYTDIAKDQLEQSLSQYLAKPVLVTIEIVEKTIEDPYQIQSHINDKRYDYAKELLKKDDIVVSLQEKFQANLDEETILAL
ncbi:MAG: DNA polymerase III subunit gamma/tau [Colwellia sp.]